MYQLKSKVRYSESNKNSRLSYYALFNYLQDTSTLHSESLGESGADLLEQNMAWIISFWQVCIEEMPRLSEDIVVSTWPYQTKGLFGLRNFQVENGVGRQIVKANSIWVMMDVRTGRPIRITEEVSSHYPDEPKLDMDYCDRKIPIPQNYESKEPIRVSEYFIDTNRHMNNAKYVMVAENFLPDDMHVREIRVEYKRPALFGDLLYPRVTKAENEFTVVLADEEGNAYATVLFLG